MSWPTLPLIEESVIVTLPEVVSMPPPWDAAWFVMILQERHGQRALVGNAAAVERRSCR